MNEPANIIRSEAEKDCRRQPAGRQNGVNLTMKKLLLFIGLDVHAQNIITPRGRGAVAAKLADPG